MANNISLRVLQPNQVINRTEADPDPNDFALQFLAHGDSWFSIGSPNPFKMTNVLFETRLPVTACAVDCAHPGSTLRHMIDWRKDPQFLDLLNGIRSRQWHAILMSAGGNDVIDAAAVPPVLHDVSVEPDKRLLLKPDEWSHANGAGRYISEAGWHLFESHIMPQYEALIAARDAAGSLNRNVPMLFHLYDYPTPRPDAPLGRALNAYQIPQKDWGLLARLLIDRLARIIHTFAMRHAAVHVVPTLGTLLPASRNGNGQASDWANEIHPSRGGYRKIGDRFADAIVSVLGLHPPEDTAVTSSFATGVGVAPLREADIASLQLHSDRPDPVSSP